MKGRATLLSLVALAAVSSASAGGAAGPSRLPADDPDTVLPGRAASAAVPAPRPIDRVGAAPGAASGFGWGSGLLWGAVGAVQTVYSAAGEFLYEASYALGTNRTPVPRPVIVDTVADIAPPPEEHRAPAPREIAATPAERVPPPAEVASAPEAAPPAATGAIDPGLLASFVYDRGARRPDGSFFLPKPLQRLFDVRTSRVAMADVPITMKLPGRIVPDPRFHGQVAAGVTGRVEPPEAGMPILGQTVREGDILGYITPTIGVLDRTQTRREVARLTTDIRIEAESLEILKQFSFVPFRDGKIYQAEQRLAGLRRERDMLLPLLRTQETLRAPTSGIISLSTAIAGRIVQPGEAVFTIVDPRKLWVEADAPDPVAATNAAHTATAAATTPEGQTLSLTFVGSGLISRQQSTPVLFRIDAPPDGLRIGRPVTVALQSENRSQRGLAISRAALTTGGDGVQEVWEQVAPEVFEPRVVRIVDLDGARILIAEGVKDGARVVVNGVRILAQLQ